MSKNYEKKLIVSGDIYEIYEYSKPIIYDDQKSHPSGRSKMASDDDKDKNRYLTLHRASQTIRRLINANVGAWGCTPKFLTLTFAENVQDIKTANYQFKLFRQRLEYELEIKLKYVVVIEFQKRGAIHYHAVFFNLPYIKNNQLAEIWGNGFVKVNKIDQVDNIGSYVTKYMTKEEQDKVKMDRLRGEKSYFSSRNLKQPIEIREKEEIEQLATALSQFKVYESSFENDYVGQIQYSQYNTKRCQK